MILSTQVVPASSQARIGKYLEYRDQGRIIQKSIFRCFELDENRSDREKSSNFHCTFHSILVCICQSYLHFLCLFVIWLCRDECQGEGLVEAQALVLLSDVLKEYVPAGDELSVSYLMWMALITGPKNELFAPAYQNQFDGFCRGKPTPIFPVPVSSGAVQITVNVLSAHQLPLVDIGEDDIELYTHDPYCVVNVVGLDEDVFTARTPTVWNNGFNPFWNEVRQSVSKIGCLNGLICIDCCVVRCTHSGAAIPMPRSSTSPLWTNRQPRTL